MNRILSFILFLTLISCQEPGSRQGHSDNSSLDSIEDQETSESGDEQDTGDREYWQKPELVIDKLGDLNNKTVADLGSGIGYFSFKLLPKAEKVIAIDVDTIKINILKNFKNSYASDLKNKLDIRLVSPSNPKLKAQEVDLILIVNTVPYITSRISYFENLKETLKPGGEIVIVDFKTKRIPDYVNAPPYSSREYLHVLEDELIEAGYDVTETDDTSLEYQFMIFASPVEGK
ncbi:MAG: methyltransferase [Saprospiraceae bacterium]|nr:methyltransferase [Saprospiraceae bacterium]